MNKPEIIDKWGKEIAINQKLVELYSNTKRYSHMNDCATKRDIITLMLMDIEELNEDSVCINCDKVKSTHELCVECAIKIGKEN